MCIKSDFSLHFFITCPAAKRPVLSSAREKILLEGQQAGSTLSPGSAAKSSTSAGTVFGSAAHATAGTLAVDLVKWSQSKDNQFLDEVDEENSMEQNM